MISAPLQLEQYFVTELRFSANPRFDPQTILLAKDFSVETDCQVAEEQCWSVLLKLTYEPELTVKVPCHFRLGIFGVFKVADGYPPSEVERLVRTNGPSILYSVSREIARGITVMGPGLALSLPPMSFYFSAGSPPKAASAGKKRPKAGQPKLGTKPRRRSER